MLDEFTYDTYRQLLELAREGNRSNLRFADAAAADPASRYFILRHDIDFSPASALRMAEFEARLGIRATYFLLFSSTFYNLLSAECCGVARRLVELGHEVGLHYDLACYDAIRRDHPLDVLLSQADALAQLSGTPVRSIAMHNPSVYGADVFQHVDRFINAYDPRYTKAIAYFSDSCGAWRDETAVLLQRRELPPRFQLLVHPLFWDREPADRWTRLDGLIAEHARAVHVEADATRSLWTRHAGVLQHDARTAASAPIGSRPA